MAVIDSADESTMNWPNKEHRENFEIARFIQAYAQFPESRRFEVVSKGESPDYVLREVQTGEEYGVELTSVYMDDRSVPDSHMRREEGLIGIPYDKEEIEKYTKRLVGAIAEKVCKALKGYDATRPLILAVYVNEYIAIYLGKAELEGFVQRHEDLFDAMTPFTEIVFWGLSNDDIFRVRPTGASVDGEGLR